jgi:hypothetical protein
MNRKSKHVIFLGAGASYTSGYPLAETLRFEWLASADTFRGRIGKELEPLDSATRVELMQRVTQWLDGIKTPLLLFREGGFGSIDEFCYHVRDAQPDAVEKLKWALQVVFGIHNPERLHAKSDYYRFIQRLFKPEQLATLREDIVVMSFNYDPYFEWLLRRAVYRRRHAINHGSIAESFMTDALVTSGFSCSGGTLKALREHDGFCVLKLHGIAAWPNRGGEVEDAMTPECCFERFFHDEVSIRIKHLIPSGVRPNVPIVFPWETVGTDGAFHSPEAFKLKDEPYTNRLSTRAGGRSAVDPHVHDIFTTIWSRAREEVQAASKISFVGLSLHEYLNFGFKYLLSGKSGDIDLVVTDSQSRQKLGGMAIKSDLNPVSPAARALKLLKNYAPAVNANPGVSVVSDRGTDKRKVRSQGDVVRLRSNFEDFINEEVA